MMWLPLMISNVQSALWALKTVKPKNQRVVIAAIDHPCDSFT